MWLLIVDDNAISRATLSRHLTRRGFSVETAESGELALQALARRRFDLVLLDVMMGGMSGIDVLREVRKTQPMSELPIIMATARDGNRDIVEALECGANDYVTKPIDLPVLLARANTQLALKEASQRIRDLAAQLEARNKFIREVFGRYITDEVVEQLLATPAGLALGGESRTVTILMSDLRGFSSLAERIEPAQVVSLLNHYLGAMTEIILRHRGTIDEFIGDAILVIFGAPVAQPDDAARAVACALEMQLAMELVNQQSAALGLPAIEMGIGINTGEVVVGNIGSDRRAKYGVVGRHVNLASRIEALTVGGQILISEATRDAVGPGLRIGRTLEVMPKGAREVMRVLEVLGIGGAHALTLPQQETWLVRLPQPLPIEFAVLDGVSAPLLLGRGLLTRISMRDVVLVTGTTIALMSVLKLRFASAAIPGIAAPPVGQDDAYGKVVGVEPDGSYVVRFTAVPPGVQQLLAVLVRGTPGPQE